MFSIGAIPGILEKPEKTIMVEVGHPTTSRISSATHNGHNNAGISTPERTSARMRKDKIKRTRDAAQAEKREQTPDLSLLYEKYKRPIHTYVYRLLGSQEDADDVTQEVFMRAFVSWQKLYDHHNLSPWLYRIATNLCVDLLRRRKRISWWPLVRRTPGAPFERSSEDDASYLPLDTGGIPEVFERDHIRLTLARMPEEYAVALVLSAAQGLSYQDIAAVLGISPNAAATRISRAKRMFADQYQQINTEETQPQERRG